MSVLGDLEQKLNIKPVDLTQIIGVDLSTPISKISEEKPTVQLQDIPDRTFGALDTLWNCNRGTAKQLYEQLCKDYYKADPQSQQLIQKIISGMRCGNISRVKVNDLVKQLIGG